jgi:hypothetical protein
MPIIPLTTSNFIQEKLNNLFSAQHFYVEPDDERLIEIKRDIDKLASKRADQSSTLRAKYAVLLGDRETADYWLRNAESLRGTKSDIELARLVVQVNLGYFSEALCTLQYVTNPENGIASIVMCKPFSASAFLLYDAMFDKAIAMKIANFPERPSFLSDVVQIMNFWGETDEDYNAVLDIAGDIMREQRVIMLESGFSAKVRRPRDGSPPTVKLTLGLQFDDDKCLDLTIDYTDRLARSNVKIPQSMTFEFVSEVQA